MSHQRPRAIRARRQHQNFITRDDLLPGEFLTEVALLTRNGHVVMLPRALISPRYQQSYIPAAAEEIWGGATQQPTAEEASFSTVRYSPMGLLSSNRSPRTWYKIPQMSPQWTIMRFPILDSELCRQKGVSTILGRPFIIWHRQFLSGLLTPRTPYVLMGVIRRQWVIRDRVPITRVAWGACLRFSPMEGWIRTTKFGWDARLQLSNREGLI